MAITTNKSAYLSDALLNWQTGTAMPTTLSNMYLALLTTMPTTNTGTGLVEVSGGSYARQTIASASWAAHTTLGDSVTQSSATNTAITFVTATANWGTIVGVALYDAASAGNLLYFGLLTASQVVNSGNQFSIPSGNLTRTEN